MENFTMVETGNGTVKKTAIAVRPFFDNAVSNMGLENYGLSLYDGVKHFEQLACLEQNGVIRYLTGLNEFAPEIKLLKGETEKVLQVENDLSHQCATVQKQRCPIVQISRLVIPLTL